MSLESRSLGRDFSSALPVPRRCACARSASSRGEALHRPPERTAAVGLDDEGTLPGRSAGGGRLLHVRTAGQLKLLRELNEWARGGGPDLEWAENAEAEGSTTARPAAVESLRTAGCGAAAPLARPEARGEAAPPPARRFPTARLGGDGRVGEANAPAPGADGCRWSPGLPAEIRLQCYRPPGMSKQLIGPCRLQPIARSHVCANATGRHASTPFRTLCRHPSNQRPEE